MFKKKILQQILIFFALGLVFGASFFWLNHKEKKQITKLPTQQNQISNVKKEILYDLTNVQSNTDFIKKISDISTKNPLEYKEFKYNFIENLKIDKIAENSPKSNYIPQIKFTNANLNMAKELIKNKIKTIKLESFKLDIENENTVKFNFENNNLASFINTYRKNGGTIIFSINNFNTLNNEKINPILLAKMYEDLINKFHIENLEFNVTKQNVISEKLTLKSLAILSNILEFQNKNLNFELLIEQNQLQKQKIEKYLNSNLAFTNINLLIDQDFTESTFINQILKDKHELSLQIKSYLMQKQGKTFTIPQLNKIIGITFDDNIVFENIVKFADNSSITRVYQVEKNSDDVNRTNNMENIKILNQKFIYVNQNNTVEANILKTRTQTNLNYIKKIIKENVKFKIYK